MKEARVSQKELEQSWKQADMRKFLLNFQSKNLSYIELSKIYKKNATSPQFSGSMFSAIALILLPSMTNIYYTYKPNGMFSKVLPVAMPIVCLIQYMGMVKYDLQNYCFKDTDDSETVRKKFKLLNQLEFSNFGIKKVNQEIQHFEKSQSQTSQKDSVEIVDGKHIGNGKDKSK